MRVVIYVEKPQTSGDQPGEKEPVTGLRSQVVHDRSTAINQNQELCRTPLARTKPTAAVWGADCGCRASAPPYGAT